MQDIWVVVLCVWGGGTFTKPDVEVKTWQMYSVRCALLGSMYLVITKGCVDQSSTKPHTEPLSGGLQSFYLYLCRCVYGLLQPPETLFCNHG
jgi:hypothetical protein